MGEPASSSGTRCRQCHKVIVWPGLCYTCATGRPRQLIGPSAEERHKAPSPAVETTHNVPAA